MEWSKLKNIIIIILLLLNLFLLLLVGGRAQQRAAAQEEMKKSTISFLQKNGIKVEEKIVPWDGQYELQMTERDQEEEARLARMILKEVKERKVGNAVEYSGERGTVCFYQDGRFSVHFNSEQGESFQNVETQAKSYLENLGLQVKTVAVYNDGTTKTVDLLQTLDESPIINCIIKMECQDGRLSCIAGWRLMGVPTVMTEQQHGLTASTLLTRFVEAVLKGDSRCTEILTITQGYLYSTGSLSAQAKLIPAWLIETDQGEVLLNCITGKVEPSSSWLNQ